MKFSARNSDYFIESLEELRSLYPEPLSGARKKQKSELDAPSKEFLAVTPFVCIATHDPHGSADCSPKGDPAGFVHIIDDKTIAIPDRKGNNRLDTLVNIVANPKVGLIFFIPGRNETLRVNGHARISKDPDLLSSFDLEKTMFKGRLPTTAIVVTIDEVYFHCPKALIRSELWKSTDGPRMETYIESMNRQLGETLTKDQIKQKAQEYTEALNDRLY